MRLPIQKIFFIFLLINPPVMGDASDFSLKDVPNEAIYAVMEIEIRGTPILYGASHPVIFSVNGNRPATDVLDQVKTLYPYIYTEAIDTSERSFSVDVSFVESADQFSLKIKYDCARDCGYQATYAFVMSGGNWIATSARYRMQ